MPDPPDSMAETTEDCSSNDNTLAIFSNLDAYLQSLGRSSRAVSTNPEKISISPPNSQFSHTVLSQPGLNWRTNFTPTIGARDELPTVEIPSTASVQLLANNINEDHHKFPLAYPFSTDGSPLLPGHNQLKHCGGTVYLISPYPPKSQRFFCF